jgi:hypothetical protein
VAREFAQTIDLREASGAAWVPASHGLPDHIIVVGDSGTQGAFAVIDAASGVNLGAGRLPLGVGVRDDLEGFTHHRDRFHALASNGYLRDYRRSGAFAFELIGEPYPIHPDLVCGPGQANCRYDFEGLCLAPGPGEGCAGYAASRKRGVLVCVTARADGRLVADPSRVLRVSFPQLLSGCDIDPDGDLLYAGNNGLGNNAVVRVHGWREPGTARLEPLGPAGAGFGEAIAVGPGGAVYRFSDTGRAPSLMSALSCPPPSP